MPNPDMFGRDVLEALEFELNFLDQGGYGRSVRKPWLSKEIFVESPTCLNFGDRNRTFPCDRCALFDFVPEDKRSENIPCHHIPLTSSGETVETLSDTANDAKAQDALRAWLQATIAELKRRRQQELDAAQPETRSEAKPAEAAQELLAPVLKSGDSQR